MLHCIVLAPANADSLVWFPAVLSPAAQQAPALEPVDEAVCLIPHIQAWLRHAWMVLGPAGLPRSPFQPGGRPATPGRPHLG